MGQMTIMTGPERRRRWSDEERLQILTEAFAPGACVSDVARRFDVSTGLIYTWRRKLTQEVPELTFAEAVVPDEPEPAIAAPGAAIVIELRGRGRICIAASTPPALAAAALKVLR